MVNYHPHRLLQLERLFFPPCIFRPSWRIHIHYNHRGTFFSFLLFEIIAKDSVTPLLFLWAWDLPALGPMVLGLLLAELLVLLGEHLTM